jgi:hypothetical protein
VLSYLREFLLLPYLLVRMMVIVALSSFYFFLFFVNILVLRLSSREFLLLPYLLACPYDGDRGALLLSFSSSSPPSLLLPPFLTISTSSPSPFTHTTSLSLLALPLYFLPSRSSSCDDR